MTVTLPIAAFAMTEKRVMGSLTGSSPYQLFLPQLVTYYQQGRLKLDEQVSREIRLDQINLGYASMANGEVARSVIVF